MNDQEVKTRFTILFWAVGIVAAVEIAILGNLISMSYQHGQTNGQLSQLNHEIATLINHVTLK